MMTIVAKKKSIHVKVDAEIKDDAENLFNELGMNMTTAINLFLKQALRDGELPFRPRLDSPESILARRDVESGNVERFDSVDEWFEAMNNDED